MVPSGATRRTAQPPPKGRRTPVRMLVRPKINFIGVLRGNECRIHRAADRTRGNGVVPVRPAQQRTPAARYPDPTTVTDLLQTGRPGPTVVPRRHSPGPTGRRQHPRPVDRLPVPPRRHRRPQQPPTITALSPAG